VKYALFALCLFANTAHAADTLDKVRAAGHLVCGAVIEAADWNKDDLHGSLEGLDRALCRAVATAALGEHAQATVKEFTIEMDAELALEKGQVDMIAGVSPSTTAAMLHHITFSPTIFYDDVAILTRKPAHIDTLKALDGRKLCYEGDTDLDRLVQARLIDQGIKAWPFPFQEEGEMDDALIGGHCDAIIAERSRIAETRAKYASYAGLFDVLPASLTLDPITAATRQDDARWTTLVAYTIHALIQAEATGVTHANAATFKPGDDPIADRLLGVDWSSAQALGLPRNWTVQVLTAVGNYGEIYDRTVGEHSVYHLPRGLNALWMNGGLMAPMPVR
jgi:general L-amino acid transport system substrate-binding protein